MGSGLVLLGGLRVGIRVSGSGTELEGDFVCDRNSDCQRPHSSGKAKLTPAFSEINMACLCKRCLML